MYDENFMRKLNLQAVVDSVLNDGLTLEEMDTSTQEERYQKYTVGISKGLKAFHKAELTGLEMEDFDCGRAADPIWKNIWALENLHFEMRFRSGAAFFADAPDFKIKPQDDLRVKEEEKNMDELEGMEQDKRFIRGVSDSYYSNMQKRVNLQSVGAMIRDGSDAKVNYSSFSERAERAYDNLKEQITKLCGEEKAIEIMEKVAEYTWAKDSISFSLGMKAGATLQVKLLDNFETDI